ncbi:glycosyltransferase family 2 protein [Vibrio cholerae]|uniref:glycosyltransferase family 2 protein n=1 Tax=Vibrio cholerae TaxID=666 RepID=UPI003016E60E
MFSIVVPLYNKELEVYNTVSSIVEAFKDFDYEIIIVNDGSTDNSLEIALNIAVKNKNIKVIDKKNGGVSSARNVGIQASIYNYIVFVDADDTILQHTGYEYFSMITSTKEKIGIYSVGYAFKDKNRIKIYNTKRALGANEWFGVVNDALSIISKYNGSCFLSCSSICINKKVIDDGEIKFPEGVTHTEDLAFYYEIIKVAPVFYSSKVCVYYNLDSSNRSNSSKPLASRYVIGKIEEDIEKNIISESLKSQAKSFVAKNYIHLVYNCLKAKKYQFFKDNLSNASRYFKNMSSYYKCVYLMLYFISLFIRG